MIFKKMSVGKITLEDLARPFEIGGKAVKLTGKAIHWAKPGLDKIIDSSATILLGNAAVSEGLYRGREFLVDNGIDILEGDLAKGATYALAFAGANIGVKIKNTKFGILPLAWKALTRKKSRDFKSYAKTAAIAGAIVAALNYGQITHDVKHAYNDFIKPQIIENAKLRNGISEFTFDLFRYLIPEREAAKLEKTVEANEIDSKAYQNEFDGSVTKDAREISDGGYPMTPEQLAYLTRLAYFETAFDKRAKKEGDVVEGAEAVANVIKNRVDFDRSCNTNMFTRKGKGKDLFNVGFNSRPHRSGGRVYEFTAIQKEPRYFYEHNGKEGWDMHAKGVVNFSVGEMNKTKANLVYEGVRNVFLGEVPDDNTKGALFYNNPKAIDKYNRNWEKRYSLKKGVSVNSHDFYVPQFDKKPWKHFKNCYKMNMRR